VRGLKEIEFQHKDGRCLTVETSFSEEGSMDEDKVVEKVTDKVKEFLKTLFGGGGEPARQAAFSEADLKRVIGESVTSATTPLTDRITALETENKTLKGEVAKHGNAATRAELIQFVEGLGHEKCPPAFKRLGLVEFMEAISGGADKVTVISFEEKDGTRVEKKVEQSPLDWFKGFMKAMPPLIAFGEHFGELRDGGVEGGELPVDANRVKHLMSLAGLPEKKEAGAAN